MGLTIYSPGGQTMYGHPQYQEAMEDWKRTYGDYSTMMSQVTPGLQNMMSYYQPGGGYGEGLRQEARETVQGGLAKDLGSMVATGMSSQFGARGANTRAASELSKLYKNIEDTRSQLWQQSTTPYAQIMSQMANVMQSRPTYGQYARLGTYREPYTTKVW